MATDTTCATTILDQLGGRGFAFMTGAKNFCAGESSLSFQLPAKPGYTRNGIRGVRVVYNRSPDDYTVTFFRWRGTNLPVTVSEHEGIYCDSLVDVFEHATGLAARFPTIRRA